MSLISCGAAKAPLRTRSHCGARHPAFSMPAPQRRPQVKRVRPIALALVVALALVCVLTLGGGVLEESREAIAVHLTGVRRANIGSSGNGGSGGGTGTGGGGKNASLLSFTGKHFTSVECHLSTSWLSQLLHRLRIASEACLFCDRPAA